MGWRTLIVVLVPLALSGCGPRADGSTAWERFSDGYMSHQNRIPYHVLSEKRKRDRQRREIERVVVAHHQAAQAVSLGEPKQQVLAKLPDQTVLGSRGKEREAILANGQLVEVYYFRSGNISDGRTTNEEFTPYVFIDGKLMAIGWMAFNALDLSRSE